ncbi:MAG: carboxypeptidase-like regulatory domain-containing protein [Acidobacteriota bacterium]
MARWAICAVLLSLFVSAAFPQASLRKIGNRINGHIILPDEQQVPEVITVTLETIAGVFVQETTVNSQRSFSFSSVDNGLWVVKVGSLGYETTETVVEMRPNEEVLAVVPLGKPLPDSRPDGPDISRSVVSVKELSVPKEARETIRCGSSSTSFARMTSRIVSRQSSI